MQCYCNIFYIYYKQILNLFLYCEFKFSINKLSVLVVVLNINLYLAFISVLVLQPTFISVSGKDKIVFFFSFKCLFF